MYVLMYNPQYDDMFRFATCRLLFLPKCRNLCIELHLKREKKLILPFSVIKTLYSSKSRRDPFSLCYKVVVLFFLSTFHLPLTSFRQCLSYTLMKMCKTFL